MNDSALARFLDKVEPEPMSGCWLWVGALRSNGYGHMWVVDRPIGAHRLSYEHWRGPIPEDKEPDHLCRVRSCVNPGHLEAVSRWTNLFRSGAIRATTHCPAGHEYNDTNTHESRWGRKCRICDRQRHRRTPSETSTR